MKIEINNTFRSRGQMADVMGTLIRANGNLPAAADFAAKFREATGFTDLVEMHVFTSVAELGSAKVEHPVLREELQKQRAVIVQRIMRDGYCLAFARSNKPRTAGHSQAGFAAG